MTAEQAATLVRAVAHLEVALWALVACSISIAIAVWRRRA